MEIPLPVTITIISGAIGLTAAVFFLVMKLMKTQEAAAVHNLKEDRELRERITRTETDMGWVKKFIDKKIGDL